MRVAALDLGSNTFLLLVAEVDEKGSIQRILHDEAKVTRLAEGVHQSRTLSPQALIRAEECFREYKKTIEHHTVDKICAVGTSAARDAKNSQEFFGLAKKFGIPIKIIPGLEEAKLTHLGATGGRELPGLCVVDVGGGSTEIITVRKGGLESFSFDLGSVRLTEMFVKNFPTLSSEMSAMEAFIHSELVAKGEKLRGKIDKLVAVAGTPSTLACLDQKQSFSAESVNGYAMNQSQLLHWQTTLANMSLNARRQLPGMDAGREDVIVAGVTILKKTLEFFDVDELEVSIRGVRFGLAIEMAKGNYGV